MPGSSRAGRGADSNKFTKLGFTDNDADDSGEESVESASASANESEGLKDLLSVQLVTMESNINSLELLAAKIPSDKKLATTAQKLRATFDEYKTEGNGNFEPVSTPVRITLNTRKRREVKGEQDDEEAEETRSKIEKLEADGENTNTNTMPISMVIDEEYSEAEESNSSHLRNSALASSKIPVPVSVQSPSDFIEIPSNYHYDPDTTTEEEKIRILDELKQHFSPFGEIPNILINSHLDMTLFADLKILGENVTGVKINLATLDSTFYSCVLEQVFSKCPDLYFLDVGKQAEEEREAEVEDDAKSRFTLLFMKTVNQYQHHHHSPLNFTISELLVDLQHFDRSNLDASAYKTFAKSRVQVSNLTVLQARTILTRKFELIKATTLILQSSRHVLNRLQLCCHSRPFLSEMEIPELPNLHTLDISANFYDKEVLFHPDFRFEKQVPNLKTLHLQLDGMGFIEKLWQSTGQGQGQGQNSGPGPAPSVKTLHFNDQGRVHDIEGAVNIFSQLEELSFPWRKNPNPSAIWKCKKLKKLLLFNVNLDSTKNSISFLAQLLALRVEDVEKLWNRNWNRKSEEAVVFDSKSIKRIGPSITALQDLETLILKPDFSWSAQQFLSLLRTLTSDSMPKLAEINFQG